MRFFAQCVDLYLFSTNYFQQLTLKAWCTILEQSQSRHKRIFPSTKPTNRPDLNETNLNPLFLILSNCFQPRASLDLTGNKYNGKSRKIKRAQHFVKQLYTDADKTRTLLQGSNQLLIKINFLLKRKGQMKFSFWFVFIWLISRRRMFLDAHVVLSYIQCLL